MYTVYMDNELLYYPGDEELAIIEPKLEQALNDAGSFEFGLPVTNPRYNEVYNRKSHVIVKDNEKEIFYGEVREIERDMNNTKTVYCVGELAWLYDSIQPQARYTNSTLREFISAIIDRHNEQVDEWKKYTVGYVEQAESNTYRFTNRENTLDAVREKVCDRLGLYMRIGKPDVGAKYLDFVPIGSYGKRCTQPIKFGVNMLDYTENLSAHDLATAVIPLGERLDDSPIEGLDAYLDITAVNGGKDYVYIQEAVERFGWIRVVQNWDDVTMPENLKAKGEEWLRSAQYESMTLELSAVDLSMLNSSFQSFEVGDMVHAIAEPFGMDTWFPVQKKTTYLQEPDKNTMELGNTMKKNYTQQATDEEKHTSQEIQQVVNTTNTQLQSAINNVTRKLTGAQGGYKLTEFDENGLWLRDLYMDAPRKEDALNVMQINRAGIGFSTKGYDGPYESAWTIDGQFVANFISTGILRGVSIESDDGSVVIKNGVITFYDLASGAIISRIDSTGFRIPYNENYTSTARVEVSQSIMHNIVGGTSYKGKITFCMDRSGVGWKYAPVGSPVPDRYVNSGKYYSYTTIMRITINPGAIVYVPINSSILPIPVNSLGHTNYNDIVCIPVEYCQRAGGLKNLVKISKDSNSGGSLKLENLSIDRSDTAYVDIYVLA